MGKKSLQTSCLGIMHSTFTKCYDSYDRMDSYAIGFEGQKPVKVLSVHYTVCAIMIFWDVGPNSLCIR